ncbi:Sodium/hydrogen exchanger family-domain-containing protein [Sparassis latifolia]
MGEFSTTILGIARSIYRKRAVASQGGLLDGQDPSDFNPSDPLRLFIIQLGVILLMTQLLSLFLRRMKQPRVIAEIIGGILLGPTAFGRIPGFTQHIFPSQSLPYLSLVANIGLCMFLFLVGLEIDGAIVKRNARMSAVVALAGMILPFGLGAALSVPLYHTFIDQSVKFTNFMLFTGVAYSITAFPVLCRILTELKLLDTTVGIVVLSAGVGNDIVGWTLLALSVALVNAGSGLTALWILLCCLGWALLLLFPVRKIIYWLARRTGSIENGPTMFFMTITVLLLFGSAFFTDVIGVQAIFGAFLAGLIVPREGGLAIALTEKLEDMVSIVFLPIYFTLSGLNTNLGLLNNGITWGYTIAICALAYTGKFGGCTLAARFVGFSWREASTIGSLMSCKGLVELIVLNVGLSAGVLSPRVFSMFVLEAILLTFWTTPAVLKLYPPEKRIRVSATGGLHHPIPKGPESAAERSEAASTQEKLIGSDELDRRTRFTVILDRIEHLPGMMALTQLLQPPPPAYAEKGGLQSLSTSETNITVRPLRHEASQGVSVDALRLIELSDRTSAVMKSSNPDMVNTDPLLNIYRTFGDLNGITVKPDLAIVTYDNLASSVAEHVLRNKSQLVLVPWFPSQYNSDQTQAAGSDANVLDTMAARSPNPYNPFESLFRATSPVDKSTSVLHAQFVRSIFSQCSTDVALFIDRHYPRERTTSCGYHLFVPFFGGPDDRAALEFVVQLCAHPRVSATVVRLVRQELDLARCSSIEKPEAAHLDADGRAAEANIRENITLFPDTVYGNATTQTRLQSETADNVVWNRHASHIPVPDSVFSAALSRVEFTELRTTTPLRSVVDYASNLPRAAEERHRRPLVITGRSRRLAVENHAAELKQITDEHGGVGNEVKKTLGDVATALIVSGCQAGVLVLQAANEPID